MTDHPYANLPDAAFWRRAVADVAPDALEPIIVTPFRLSPRDKIATAGSCFAQHIGRHIKSRAGNFLVTERPHPFIMEQAAHVLNFEVYTARYGNIYTSRQLLQLFERAYGRFTPKENYWIDAPRRVIDPFRPQIQPGGFNSTRELDFDRERHFKAVREAFETLDVLSFTLGLTEMWRSKDDGAVYPICPGVAGGEFSSDRHEFVNLGVDEVVDDMTTFITRLREVNRKARVILTVSPVPLVATVEPRHVLTSTTFSKSVLRVACEMLVRAHAGVAYFPSYEIVAGAGVKTNYFAPDRRSVTSDGVAHVMRIFDRHFMGKGNIAQDAVRRTARVLGLNRAQPEDPVAAALKLMCDEEALNFFAPTQSREAQADPASPLGKKRSAQEPLANQAKREAHPGKGEN